MNQLEKFIQAELQKLDRDLFLDKELYGNTVMHCVKYNIGSGHPPLRVLDWHMDNKALPLSSSIIDRVKSFEGDITQSVAEVKRNNEAKKLALNKEVQDVMETISDEFDKSAKRLHMSGPWSRKRDQSAYKKPS